MNRQYHSLPINTKNPLFSQRVWMIHDHFQISQNGRSSSKSAGAGAEGADCGALGWKPAGLLLA